MKFALIIPICRVILAYLVAPAVAFPAYYVANSIIDRELMWPWFDHWLGFFGIVGYMTAFVPVLFSGSLLLGLALAYPPLRRIHWWPMGGAAGGLMVARFLQSEASIPPYRLFVVGAATGAACALVFRLIAGQPFGRVRSASTA
jgi:hypothetical protein